MQQHKPSIDRIGEANWTVNRFEKVYRKTFNDLFLSFLPFFFSIFKTSWWKKLKSPHDRSKITREDKKNPICALLTALSFRRLFLISLFYSYETEICLRYEQPWPEKTFGKRVNIHFDSALHWSAFRDDVDDERRRIERERESRIVLEFIFHSIIDNGRYDIRVRTETQSIRL